jgi:amino acid permease
VAVQECSARERATIASEFDSAEVAHGRHAQTPPTIFVAMLPLIVVIAVNFAMSLFVLPRLDTSFLAEERWGARLSLLSVVSGPLSWRWRRLFSR